MLMTHQSFRTVRFGRGLGLLLLLVCMIFVLPAASGVVLAQDDAETTAEAEVTDTVEMPTTTATATSTVTATQTLTPTFTSTPTFTPTITPTQTPSLTPTPRFPDFLVRLSIEPTTTSGNFQPGDEITFTVRATNVGGGTLVNRSVRVTLIYDTEVFRDPSIDNISGSGTAEGSTITWIVDSFPEGEENSLAFTFKNTIRSDLKEGKEAKASASISTNFELQLAQSSVVTIPVVVTNAVPASAITGQVPQGEGLFQDSGSFALLIGAFFGIGALLIAALSGLVISRMEEDDAREHTFRGTTEVLLLLIVMFSVIVMGVQNAIDRESINAIIGGIVGYVAGRVSNRVSLPRELMDRLASSRDTGGQGTGGDGDKTDKGDAESKSEKTDKDTPNKPDANA